MNKILTYLEESAAKYPDKIVFGDVNVELSFAEFHNLSRRIGTALINKNTVMRPVMIMMDKTPYTLAAFFGVMYSRNFYVPVDVDMPEDRLKKIVANLSPEFIICDDNNEEKATKYLAREKVLRFDSLSDTDIDCDKLIEVSRSILDVDPIYIIYTSGTTGTPKGVVVPIRALVDYVDNFCKEVCIDETDIIANQAPFYFDGSLIDIYCTIKLGASMFIIPRQFFSMPMKLVDFLNQYKVTAFRWVPSAFNSISIFNVFSEEIPRYLKTAIFVGEVMPIKCFNYWKKYLPNVRYIQIYGPTETVGVCTFFYVEKEYEAEEKIPIGRPFENSKVVLIDESGTLIDSVGKQGEICVGGSCVSLGYYNMPEKTASSFIQNPLNTCYSELIYKTGDIAEYNQEGDLIFVGRKDFQIKHMGYRIELGEIEATALSISEMSEVACIYDEEKDNIILFYTSGDPYICKKSIEEKLKNKLVSYMYPQKIVKLESMPKLPNGKTDRSGLKKSIQK